jgi:2-polyprenyl-3-methyl-5-hydroxy-6-metoxy-1,4-benzoquinol methylase
MADLRLPELRVPRDMRAEDMPDLLRYWYVGSRARRHMVRRRFLEVDAGLRPALGGRVLDIGSAWGYNVMALSHLGADAVGLDLVLEPFAAGRRIASENGLTLTVVGADAAVLPFSRSVFRGISMVEVIEHVFEDDRQALFDECFRVLAPGGLLALSTPNYGGLVERLKRVVTRYPALKKRLPTMCYPAPEMPRSSYHPHRYHKPWPARRLGQALERTGFRIRSQATFLFVTKNTPDGAFAMAAATERVLERIPVLRGLAATLCIVAEKPAGAPEAAISTVSRSGEPI